jgi:hypothetical protein
MDLSETPESEINVDKKLTGYRIIHAVTHDRAVRPI